ncbi:hypothetical protein C8T65DRAFT_654912 [Cerioporus squamosus]|nr:hypothetical protein C8T65DRAFT_654912 [Cerioporus squamosus]
MPDTPPPPLPSSSIQAPTPAEPPPPVSLTPSGKHRARAPDEYKQYGRRFGATVEMFAIPAIVMQAAWERDHTKQWWEYTVQQRRDYRAFEQLREIVPNLDEIMEKGRDVNGRTLQSIQTTLFAGSNAERSDNTRTVKINIIEWMANKLKVAGVSLSSTTKDNRGFNNPVTGAELCPAELDYNDEQIRTALANHTATVNGDLVDGSHWPKFCYEHGQYNPEAPESGFLRGSLIVLAFLHIFRSPSSAFAADITDAANAGRGTRSGKAEIHGITQVTLGAIAYAATHVHFALGPLQAFNKNHTHNQSVVFYHSLMEFFDDLGQAAFCEELLTWWNRRIFPAQFPSSTKKNHGLERIRAARALRVAAAGAAAANVPGPGGSAA